MNILSKKIFFLAFFLLLIICQPVVIQAVEENLAIKNEVINPGSFYYSFKRLWEKGMDKLQFSKELKINFYKSQLKTRLAELNYVVENKLLSEVQQSSERFSFYAGILTDELVRQNKVQDKEKAIKEFEKYSIFLNKLRDNYPANTSFWMLIQHDINSLDILSKRLK